MVVLELAFAITSCFDFPLKHLFCSACRAGCSLRTCGALRADCALRTLRTLRALRTDRPHWSLRADGTGGAGDIRGRYAAASRRRKADRPSAEVGRRRAALSASATRRVAASEE